MANKLKESNQDINKIFFQKLNQIDEEVGIEQGASLYNALRVALAECKHLSHTEAYDQFRQLEEENRHLRSKLKAIQELVK